MGCACTFRRTERKSPTKSDRRGMILASLPQSREKDRPRKSGAPEGAPLHCRFGIVVINPGTDQEVRKYTVLHDFYDGRNWQVRSSREQERGRTDQMTPLSVAQTVGLGAARELQQIRLATEPGLHDEGGSVEALIGRSSRTPAALASFLDRDGYFFTAVCASLWLVRPVRGLRTAETTVPHHQGRTDFLAPSVSDASARHATRASSRRSVLCTLRKSAWCDMPE
jgi:hypothetical protein